MSDGYTPIDCGLHDELQLLALRRRAVRLQVEGEADPVEGRVADVRTRDGAEWLLLDSGREIRLDRLVAVDGRPFRP